jgi:hypothetical protein
MGTRWLCLLGTIFTFAVMLGGQATEPKKAAKTTMSLPDLPVFHIRFKRVAPGG